MLKNVKVLYHASIVLYDNILFLSETDISQIENKIEETEPKFCIIDSIQTMYDEDISSVPGSISQVAEEIVFSELIYV